MSRKPATKELQQKIDELTADLQRVQAEYLNFKRRENEAKAELLELAKKDVVTQLLPALDNIDRALAHKPDDLNNHPWASGVEQAARQMSDSLKKIGVEKIAASGEPFDHNLHEAISMEDGEGEDYVAEELQTGYRMGESVIRHAMVRVGKRKEK